MNDDARFDEDEFAAMLRRRFELHAPDARPALEKAHQRLGMGRGFTATSAGARSTRIVLALLGAAAAVLVCLSIYKDPVKSSNRFVADDEEHVEMCYRYDTWKDRFLYNPMGSFNTVRLLAMFLGDHYLVSVHEGTRSEAPTVRVWSGKQWDKVEAEWGLDTLAEGEFFCAACFTPGGRHLLITTSNRITVWKTGTWERVEPEFLDYMGSICFLPGGKSFIAARAALPPEEDDGSLVWPLRKKLYEVDSKTFEIKRTLEFGETLADTESLSETFALSPDGHMLAVQAQSMDANWEDRMSVAVFDVESLALIKRLPVAIKPAPDETKRPLWHCGWLQFSADGSALFAEPDNFAELGGEDAGSLKGWRVATWKELPINVPHRVMSMLPSVDGKTMFCGIRNNEVWCIDTQTGEVTHTFKCDYGTKPGDALPMNWYGATALVTSANGDALVVGCTDRSIQLWSGEPVKVQKPPVGK